MEDEFIVVEVVVFEFKDGGVMMREEVIDNDVVVVVSRWTGVFVVKFVLSEKVKLL